MRAQGCWTEHVPLETRKASKIMTSRELFCLTLCIVSVRTLQGWPHISADMDLQGAQQAANLDFDPNLSGLEPSRRPSPDSHIRPDWGTLLWGTRVCVSEAVVHDSCMARGIYTSLLFWLFLDRCF